MFSLYTETEEVRTNAHHIGIDVLDAGPRGFRFVCRGWTVLLWDGRLAWQCPLDKSRGNAADVHEALEWAGCKKRLLPA